MSSSPPTEAPATSFVCECLWHMHSACKGLPFYKKHEGKRYCVLHYPGKDKGSAFDEVLKRKLEDKDFDFRGVWFPHAINFENITFTAPTFFNLAVFSAEVSFKSSTFAAAAVFSFVTFNAEAAFRVVTFNDEACFFSATFNAEAAFTFDTFVGDAILTSINFNAGVSFGSVTFKAKAIFAASSFKDYLNFSGFTGEHA